MAIGVIRPRWDFNPRSPCGERLHEHRAIVYARNISIHALLAESDLPATSTSPPPEFQSTLSLRRATPATLPRSSESAYFNPRSPCGERPALGRVALKAMEISIHALLAESDGGLRPDDHQPGDFNPRSPCGERHGLSTREAEAIKLFQSTLSLRRATDYVC